MFRWLFRRVFRVVILSQTIIEYLFDITFSIISNRNELRWIKISFCLFSSVNIWDCWIKNCWVRNCEMKNYWIKNFGVKNCWIKNCWIKNCWIKNCWIKINETTTKRITFEKTSFSINFLTLSNSIVAFVDRFRILAIANSWINNNKLIRISEYFKRFETLSMIKINKILDLMNLQCKWTSSMYNTRSKAIIFF